MRTSPPLPLFPLLCTLFLAAQALRLPIEGRRQTLNSPDRPLTRRASLTGQSSIVGDEGDTGYFVNITLGGLPFSVIMDTGSSDLWVATNQASQFPILDSQTVTIDYAIGAAQGPVATGLLNFAGFEVPSQAFMLVTPDTAHPAGQGLIGLGPAFGSRILQSIGTLTADPALDRIFNQNTTIPSYITIRLGRVDDPTAITQGDLTIGELLPQFQNITSQSKLPVSVVTSDQTPNQHWQTLLDPDGVVGPDGIAISTPSVAATKLGDSTPNQLVFIFDTGFTLPQVPKYISDGIYSSVPGAVFQNLTGVGPIWVLPCDAEVNVTFKFGGQNIPIHPLDTNILVAGENHTCLGAFQPIQPSAEEPEADGIFGMAFLRNVYMLIEYGDFIDHAANSTGESSTRGSPYIQLLSTTDPATAHQEFLDVRVNNKSTTAVGSSPKQSGTSRLDVHLSSIWTTGLLMAGVFGLLFSS